jgi:RING finger protein 113A
MSYFKLTEEQLRKKKTSGTLRGPQVAQKGKRVTSRVDYNPERCKDYYEHGYCPFGDTCIYIHDRGDYKNGAQLDQEWDEAQRKK